MIAPIPGGSKYSEPLDGTIPAHPDWPTGVTAPPDPRCPHCGEPLLLTDEDVDALERELADAEPEEVPDYIIENVLRMIRDEDRPTVLSGQGRSPERLHASIYGTAAIAAALVFTVGVLVGALLF